MGNIATKDQERAALDKIRKIVDGLGENSYLSMAFQGCFEIAEQNIENDAAFSLKDAAYSLKDSLDRSRKELCAKEEQVKDLETKISDLTRQLETSRAEEKKLQEVCKRQAFSEEDLENLITLLGEKRNQNLEQINLEAARIVELAEDSQAPEFQSAVTRHKALKVEAEEYQLLEDKCKAMQKPPQRSDGTLTLAEAFRRERVNDKTAVYLVYDSEIIWYGTGSQARSMLEPAHIKVKAVRDRRGADGTTLGKEFEIAEKS